MRKTSLPPSTKRIRTRNPKRRKSEFARAYGSKARVAFVKSLPCVACRIPCCSENAHIETGGTGRKADYTEIVPLCRDRLASYFGSPARIRGCHGELHDHGRHTLEAAWGINLRRCAADTEAAWQALIGIHQYEEWKEK